MTFSRGDLMTFAIGVAVTVALAVGQTLAQLDMQAVLDDPQPVLVGAAGSMLTSLGRYIVTWLAQRGVTGD